VSSLLDGHITDELAILGGEASLNEVLIREDGEAVIEKVELDILLVEAKSKRLEVEVRVDHIARFGAIRSQTTSRHIRSRSRVEQRSIRIVVGVGRIRRKRSN
jgi:hypothetical protein